MLRLKPGEIFANNYRLVRLIDTGGFADVWEAVFLSAGNTVALKIYPMLDADGVKNIEDEYKNQADLSHSHLLIARYFGKHDGYPFLEMKYCSGGNAGNKLGKFDEKEIVKCFYHIASALEYLHEEDIVHQDIKPSNFLIDKNGNYFLADLGLSLNIRKTIARFTQKKSGEANPISINGITPPPYRAPELYDRKNIGAAPIKATDIWALGASIFEMITGDTPFGDLGGITQTSENSPDISSEYSKELNLIIQSCLLKDTWERPKAAELVNWTHNYLRNNSYEFTPKFKKTEKKADDNKTIIDDNIGKKTIPINDDPSKNNNNGNRGSETKKDDPAIGPIDNGGNKPKPQTAMWIALIIVIAAIGYGIYAYTHRSGYNDYHTSSRDSTKVTDTIKPKDMTKAKITDTTKMKADTAKKMETPPTVKTLNVNDAKVTLNPYVETPPSTEKIVIKKIERTASALKVYFILKKESDGETFTIYGPDTPDNCFFINVDGTKYNLVNITPKGSHLGFGGSRTFKFTATFQAIPSDVHTIDIIEGADRDNINQNYWTFRGIHVN